MKAWPLNNPGPVNTRPLKLTEVPLPFPAEDELLMHVDACGFCRSDLHVIEGELQALRSPRSRLTRFDRGCAARSALLTIIALVDQLDFDGTNVWSMNTLPKPSSED